MVYEGFVLKETLGHSLDGNATVMIAERSSTGVEKKVFLAKRLALNMGPSVTQSLEHEINMSGKLNKLPNILSCEEHFIYGKYLYVILPEVKGSLHYLMQSRYIEGLLESSILVVLHHVITVISAIHSLGYTHGSLCAAHIYIDNAGIVKVGYAASVFDDYFDLDRDSSSVLWPVTHLYDLAGAPEADKSFKSDIWMIGVVGLELIYGGLRVMKREEFDNAVRKISSERQLPYWIYERYSKLDKRVSPIANKSFSLGLVNLVASCLNLDPKQRPTAEDLLTLDIFSTPLSSHQPSKCTCCRYH